MLLLNVSCWLALRSQNISHGLKMLRVPMPGYCFASQPTKALPGRPLVWSTKSHRRC
jgi:hypothetical protein